MREELNLLGVFIPAILLDALIAFVLVAVLRRVLAFIGAYRLLWHRPLVDICLLVITLAIVTETQPRWMP
ncbi:MAG TPA: DUF1656 domain-containing protein [Acetobacteraceae bacterium]|nr:DUF1656 domain-containing protein [Acetobacteraceae bacterium]